MINAMVVCLRGARNVDVLFVYFRCTCLMERDSSRTGYNVMHVLRHVIEQLVSHYEMEQRVVANMTCLLYTSPSPRDRQKSRMPSSA